MATRQFPGGPAPVPARTGAGSRLSLPRPRTTAVLGLITAAPLLLATGCSSGLAEPLGKSAEEASAAVGSAAMVLRLETEDKATRALSQTTIENMVAEGVAAYKSAGELTPQNPDDLALQQDVLQNLDAALRTLHSAQLAQETGDDAAYQAAVDQLQGRAAELAELGEELKQ